MCAKLWVSRDMFTLLTQVEDSGLTLVPLLLCAGGRTGVYRWYRSHNLIRSVIVATQLTVLA